MNIMSVCNKKLKWNRRVTEKGEEMVGGGRKERESMLSFGIYGFMRKKRKKEKKLVLDLTL